MDLENKLSIKLNEYFNDKLKLLYIYTINEKDLILVNPTTLG
jgi:hypothetical protein